MNSNNRSTHSVSAIVFAVLFTFLQAAVAGAFDDPNRNETTTAQSADATTLNNAEAESNSGAVNNSNELGLPSRTSVDASREESTSSSGKSQLMDVGLKLGIVIGVFLIVMILMSKKSDSSMIPKEAIEVLGRVPFSGKQTLQLVRFGQKLVLVESSSNGLKPISEMTDPMEVQQMLNMINTKRR